MEKNTVCYDVLSPVKFMARSVEVYPEKVAVIYGEKHYSYSEFGSRVNRLANALKKSGIKKGDKIWFPSKNCHRKDSKIQT